MKWVMKEPARGDMIRVALGGLYHFGIFVSEEEVIQFGLAPTARRRVPDSEVEVLASDIDAFLAGGFLEVCEFDRKERKSHPTPDEVVARARQRLGERGYHILYNNCEHFATECVTGQRTCRQTEDLRALFRSLPVVDVYLATLPDTDEMPPLSCALRQADIDGVSHPTVRREKYFVWRLLEYALQRSFGFKSADLTFQKEAERYYCDKAYFSLSHGDGLLAVAVSRDKVGIDVERVTDRDTRPLAQRVFTPEEWQTYDSLPAEEQGAYFFRTWTAKEALFKAAHREVFDPRCYTASAAEVKTMEKTVGDTTFCLSVATKTPQRIRVYENIAL